MLDSIRVEKDNNSLILLLTIWSIYKIQSSIIDQSITTSLCLLVRFSTIEWFSFNGIKAIDLLAKNSVKKFKNIIISYYIHRWGNQFITHFLSNPLLARFPASKLPLTRPWRFLRHYIWCNRAIKQRAPRSGIARAG